MMGFKRTLAVLLIVGVLIVVLLAGCTKFSPGDPAENIRPETTLSFAPDQDDNASYRVRMNWFGWDPDGKVAYYWTKWDTMDWVRVVSTDSVFLVSAHADSVDSLKGYEYHSFSVKAVDNDGDEDLSPESISFTAFTLVPDTDIVRGPSGVTGPMVTFEWLGTDRDGVIASYAYKLFRWEISTLEWIQVSSQDSLDADCTVANFGPLAGLHRFEVWSTDDAGASDQSPAVREFTCNPDLAGPKLYAYSNVFGLRVFRGPVWNPDYNLPTPIFAGERLTFRWSASAESYGGQVMGYRHAYDDTSTWPAWSVYDTEFSVTPTLGRHSLFISAIDNSNVVTRGRFYFDVVEATLDEFILIVDDWDDGEGDVGMATDEERSGFWNDLLSGYEHERVEWQPDQHEQGSGPEPPDVETLRSASTVIWYTDLWQETPSATELGDLFNPQLSGYNALAGYMRVGGNLILSGYRCLEQITRMTYPMEIADTDTTEGARFVRDILHISAADASGTLPNKNSPWKYGYCLYGDVPSDAGESYGFEPMYIDSVGPGGYPDPGKWYMYVLSYPNYSRCGLPDVEKLETYLGAGLEIYTIDSFLNMNYEGMTSCVLYLSGDDRGNTCYFGHPLYFFQADQVAPNFDRIMALFGEQKLTVAGQD